MSERSKSLVKMVLVGVALIALLIGAAQVLIEDDGPVDPATASATGSTTPATSDAPVLVAGDRAADPAAKQEATSLPDAKAVDVADAAPAAAKPTWAPAVGSFTGRVLDGSGAGIPKAKVSLLTFDPERLKGIPEGMRSVWLAQMKKQGNMAQLFALLKAVESAPTDAEGRFSFKAPDGKVEHWLRIEHADYCDVVSHDFKLAPASLSVTLQKGGTVEVTVTTAEGAPLTSPLVTIAAEEGAAPQVQAAPLAFELDSSQLVSGTSQNVAVAMAKKAAVVKEAAGDAAQEVPPAPAASPTHTQTLRSVPSGRHTVFASADGFRVTSAAASVTEGGRVAVSITLQVGLTLNGTVVDGRGNPIPNATVSAYKQGAFSGKQTHRRQLSAQTDAKGAFSLKGLEDAVYQTSAHAAGYQQANWNTQGTPGGDPLKIVLNKTRAIRGKVVLEPGGKPAGAGLTLKALKRSQAWFGGGGQTTKEDGSFEVTNLLPGRYTLTAKNTTLTTLDPVEVTIKDADVEGIVIKVRAGAEVEVVVVSKNGGPVEGAKVAALTGQNTEWAGRFAMANKATQATDAKGKVALTGLGPGEYRVLVSHDDYAKGEATLRIDEGKEPGPLRVELVPGAILEATLVAADGTPYAGKMVLIMSQDATLMSPAAFQNSVNTDDQGRFTKTGMSAGSYRLQAMEYGNGKGGGMRPIGDVQLQAGQTTKVELRIKESSASVSGRVLQGTKPQAGAQVMVYQEQDMMAGFSQAMTDKDGAFKIEKLPAGTYAVLASGADKAVVELKETSAVDVTLEIQAGVVAGRVVGPDGAPATGAQLLLKRTDANATIEDMFRNAERTDGLGNFKLDKVRPGSYVLIATAPGVGASKGVEFTLGNEEARTGLNIVLTKGGTLSLSVKNPDDTPAVGASVSFYHVGLKLFSQQMQGWGSSGSNTDRHGSVKLENLVPGTYVLFLSSAGHKQALLENVTIGDGATVSQAATLAAPGALEISAPAGTNVTVKLVASGTPMGGSGLPWASVFGLSKTNDQGVLKVPNLPSVEVEIRGKTSDGRDVGPWRGTIVSGETTKASLN